MRNITFNVNNCVSSNDTDDIATGNFSNGCIVMKYTLISFETLKCNDNYCNVIFSIKHNKDAYSESDTLSTNVDTVKVSLTGGIFTAFIYLTNMTNGDEVYNENSTFDSPNREYILQATSKLYDSILNNCSKSAVIWTKSDKNYRDNIYSEYGGDDGNNCNLGLNFNISNNKFCSFVVNGIFGSNSTVSIGNNIYFDYNIIKDKSLNWGNEYLTFSDTKEREVSIQLVENDCENLNVFWFIISNGSSSMIHGHQTIKENKNFVNTTDPLLIRLGRMEFENFSTPTGDLSGYLFPEYCWEFKCLSTLDKVNNAALGKHLEQQQKLPQSNQKKEKQQRTQKQVKTSWSWLVTILLCLFCVVTCFSVSGMPNTQF